MAARALWRGIDTVCRCTANAQVVQRQDMPRHANFELKKFAFDRVLNKERSDSREISLANMNNVYLGILRLVFRSGESLVDFGS